MNCCKCNSVLIRENMSGYIIMKCHSCSGIWIEGKELYRFESKHCVSIDTNKINIVPTKYTCCSCSKELREITLFIEGEDLDIDQCVSCKGIWFDEGELKKLAMLAESRLAKNDKFYGEKKGEFKDMDKSNSVLAGLGIIDVIGGIGEVIAVLLLK